MDRSRNRFAAVACVSVVAGGCFAVTDLDRFREGQGPDAATSDALVPNDAPPTNEASPPPRDAGDADDASGVEGETGALPPESGTPESGAADEYLDVTDSSNWMFFDATGAGGSTGYSGVVFDGRYLYFVPQFSPPNVLRYDTHGAFNEAASWTFFAPTDAIVAAGGSSTGSYTYLGGAFDGRYVYLAPFGSNTFAVQYDTQGSFASDASWSAFKASTLDSTANYWGVVSDGRYAYFMPNTTTRVLVFDNAAAPDGGSGFASSASWTTFNLGTGAAYEGYWGGVMANRALYMTPFSTNVVGSHDTTQPVTSASAWNVGANGFDLSNNEQISPPHYWGSAFDGTHVYLVPYKTQSWTLAAYDTSGSFTDDGSWSTCALQAQLFGGAGSSTGFVGAAFDGRRLFLAPLGQLTAPDGGPAALPIVAYDTTQPLCPSDLTTAYTRFDPTTVPGGATAQGFEGAAFDGQYVYFVPHVGSVVARFQAKPSNGGLAPADYRGSWW